MYAKKHTNKTSIIQFSYLCIEISVSYKETDLVISNICVSSNSVFLRMLKCRECKPLEMLA